jgi:osmotically inducible protein OsmC
MPEFSRRADVQWNGGLLDGKGQVKAGTGAFALPVTFPVRIGEPEGHTSPEELIAAAHASCYAMAFNATLGRRGGKADRTEVTATVTANKGDAGITITSSHLTLVVHGLQGIDASQLDDVARQAEGGCPVSNALRGNLTIEVEARLAKAAGA